MIPKETSSETEPVAYWNQNIARERWTEECPGFLIGLDKYDIKQVGIRDEDYKRVSWAEVKEIIQENRLQSFKRVPSDLRRYRAFLARIKESHGSVMNFVLKERVKWEDLTPKGAPFEYPDDLRILYNDWPYGIDSNIIHLVVWVKSDFEEDPNNGDLTASSRKQIAEFVDATFGQNMPSQNIAWFRNWAALKSVHAVEHIHVMLYAPDPVLMERLTHGDQPMAAKLTNEELYGW